MTPPDLLLKASLPQFCCLGFTGQKPDSYRGENPTAAAGLAFPSQVFFAHTCRLRGMETATVGMQPEVAFARVLLCVKPEGG